MPYNKKKAKKVKEFFGENPNEGKKKPIDSIKDIIKGFFSSEDEEKKAKGKALRDILPGSLKSRRYKRKK